MNTFGYWSECISVIFGQNVRINNELMDEIQNMSKLIKWNILGQKQANNFTIKLLFLYNACKKFGPGLIKIASPHYV